MPFQPDIADPVIQQNFIVLFFHAEKADFAQALPVRRDFLRPGTAQIQAAAAIPKFFQREERFRRDFNLNPIILTIQGFHVNSRWVVILRRFVRSQRGRRPPRRVS